MTSDEAEKSPGRSRGHQRSAIVNGKEELTTAKPPSLSVRRVWVPHDQF